LKSIFVVATRCDPLREALSPRSIRCCPDDTCRFLAADFDKESWGVYALAMIDSCQAKGVPASLERSRSGNGGHVWIFFSEPIPARTARQLGAAIVTGSMERRPEIGFTSYDRFFPNQERLILATGRYIGGGFDDRRLDTLFLTMPVPPGACHKALGNRLSRPWGYRVRRACASNSTFGIPFALP
jgi:hypothetical protein